MVKKFEIDVKIRIDKTGSFDAKSQGVVQGQSWQTGFFESALRDRIMQAKFF